MNETAVLVPAIGAGVVLLKATHVVGSVSAVVAFLAIAAALPAAPAAAQSTIEVAYTLGTLPNGLRLIIHEDHSAPVVSVNVWYHVGSGDEKPGRTGFVPRRSPPRAPPQSTRSPRDSRTRNALR
jgi:hypothetical protein